MFNIFKRQYLIVYSYTSKNHKGVGNMSMYSYCGVGVLMLQELQEQIRKDIEAKVKEKVCTIVITNVIKCSRFF